MDTLERFRGCLLGLAIGDAVGTTVEFQRRGSFAPITDLVGGGPFHLKPGQWTDDTSMALCLATSLVSVGAFDPGDQMHRYCDWQDPEKQTRQFKTQIKHDRVQAKISPYFVC